MSSRQPVFRGWWMVASAFVVLAVTDATGFFSFSLFVKPIQADLGWSRGDLMLAFTAWSFAIAVAAPFVGRLVDRFGPARVVAVSAALNCLSFVVLGTFTSLWQFYTAYAVSGFSFAGMGSVPLSTMVSNWFSKRRGLAIGVMSSGIGAGGLVFAPLLGGVFIPDFGWRAGYFIVAALLLLIPIPLAMLVMKARPADVGRQAYGGPSALNPVRRPTLGGTGLKVALGSPAFWLIALSYLLSATGLASQIQDQAPHLEDMGVSVATAAGALGLFGAFTSAAKFGFGWLCDRLQPHLVWAIAIGFQMVGAAILLLVNANNAAWSVWVLVVIVGIGAGGWLPTMSLIVSSTFGLASYAAIFGMVSFVFSAGQGLGPLITGHVYDATGSYQPMFVAILGGYAVALAAALLIRRKPAK